MIICDRCFREARRLQPSREEAGVEICDGCAAIEEETTTAAA